MTTQDSALSVLTRHETSAGAIADVTSDVDSEMGAP